jgi:sarcosine oxidase subunit alpha
VVRQLSGLGKLPERAPDEVPAVRRADVDVAVIGGGPAGLAAATAASRAGARVVLIDDQLRPGGCMLADPRYGVSEADRRVHSARSAGVAILSSSTAIAFYPEDDGGLLAVATPTGLVRVTARRFVYATGGYPVNLLFGDNDRPGVVAARGVGRLLVQHAVLAGDRVCIVEGEGQADYAAALAEALHAAGAEVTRIPADDVERSKGRNWVKSLDRCSGDRVDCDVVAVAAVPAPASEAPRQHGCHVVLDPSRGGFRVVVDEHGQTSVADVLACGDVCGYMGPAAATQMGSRVGTTAATAAIAARATAQEGATHGL